MEDDATSGGTDDCNDVVVVSGMPLKNSPNASSSFSATEC